MDVQKNKISVITSRKKPSSEDGCKVWEVPAQSPFCKEDTTDYYR